MKNKYFSRKSFKSQSNCADLTRHLGRLHYYTPTTMSEPDTLLAFKAGRAFRREGSNVVEPSPTKGAIYLINDDEGLLHFQWKNRESGNMEEVCLGE